MSIPDRPTCVVTGAASGLGRAFCLELARRGGRVVVSDVNEPGARETAAMLGGAEAHVFRCDVSKRDEVEALAAFAEDARAFAQRYRDEHPERTGAVIWNSLERYASALTKKSVAELSDMGLIDETGAALLEGMPSPFAVEEQTPEGEPS